MQIFGKFIHDGRLWYLHRRSVRGAFAVGLFAALMPMPGQTILAVALAILFRVNIPLSVALCWLTNPFTMAPIFFICYNIGVLVLGLSPQQFEFQASFEWLLASIHIVGKPFLVGSLIFASAVSATFWLSIDGLWRLNTRRACRKRQIRRRG